MAQQGKDGAGRLLVLIPGMGAVASTFIAGVELLRRNQRLPIGSLTQLARLEVNSNLQEKNISHSSNLPYSSLESASSSPLPPRMKELLPFVALEDLCFAGWDVLYTNLKESLESSQVLTRQDLQEVQEISSEVPVLPGYFQPRCVPALAPRYCLPSSTTPQEAIVILRRNIEEFRKHTGADRAVMVILLSTETHDPHPPLCAELSHLEEAIRSHHPGISPTLIYAYAALLEGIPVINGTPNYALESPALIELSELKAVPLAGKDLKSGQTFIKTALAPALRHRCLGVKGWFSTNILGNRDGEVLNHPQAFRAKEATKSRVLSTILDSTLYPELYGELYHKVRIEYYPPRGDNKEGWDNIDLLGWLGYPMEIKVNFLCRDSILAAPLVLDLVLLANLAQRFGEKGLLGWLGFYFKDPLSPPGVREEHDLFRQFQNLVDHIKGWCTALSPI